MNHHPNVRPFTRNSYKMSTANNDRPQRKYCSPYQHHIKNNVSHIFFLFIFYTDSKQRLEKKIYPKWHPDLMLNEIRDVYLNRNHNAFQKWQYTMDNTKKKWTEIGSNFSYALFNSDLFRMIGLVLFLIVESNIICQISRQKMDFDSCVATI